MVDSINTNTASIAARNALSRNNKELSKVQQDLATGSLIADPSNLPGPAGVAFAISADIKTTQAAAKNLVQGEAYVQTGTGALATLQELHEQMSSLAATANNDMTLDAGALTNLQLEMDALTAEAKNVVDTTKFNGVSYFTGANTFQMQVGTESSTVLSHTTTDLTSMATAGDTAGFLDITSASAAATALTTIASERVIINNEVAKLGALKSRMGFIANNLGTTIQNFSGAKAAFADTDIPAALERSQTLAALVDVSGAMMSKTLEKAGKLSELVKNMR
jgi:flagellin